MPAFQHPGLALALLAQPQSLPGLCCGFPCFDLINSFLQAAASPSEPRAWGGAPCESLSQERCGLGAHGDSGSLSQQ